MDTQQTLTTGATSGGTTFAGKQQLPYTGASGGDIPASTGLSGTAASMLPLQQSAGLSDTAELSSSSAAGMATSADRDVTTGSQQLHTHAATERELGVAAVDKTFVDTLRADAARDADTGTAREALDRLRAAQAQRLELEEQVTRLRREAAGHEAAFKAAGIQATAAEADARAISSAAEEAAREASAHTAVVRAAEQSLQRERLVQEAKSEEAVHLAHEKTAKLAAAEEALRARQHEEYLAHKLLREMRERERLAREAELTAAEAQRTAALALETQKLAAFAALKEAAMFKMAEANHARFCAELEARSAARKKAEEEASLEAARMASSEIEQASAALAAAQAQLDRGRIAQRDLLERARDAQEDSQWHTHEAAALTAQAEARRREAEMARAEEVTAQRELDEVRRLKTGGSRSCAGLSSAALTAGGMAYGSTRSASIASTSGGSQVEGGGMGVGLLGAGSSQGAAPLLEGKVAEDDSLVRAEAVTVPTGVSHTGGGQLTKAAPLAAGMKDEGTSTSPTPAKPGLGAAGAAGIGAGVVGAGIGAGMAGSSMKQEALTSSATQQQVTQQAQPLPLKQQDSLPLAEEQPSGGMGRGAGLAMGAVAGGALAGGALAAGLAGGSDAQKQGGALPLAQQSQTEAAQAAHLAQCCATVPGATFTPMPVVSFSQPSDRYPFILHARFTKTDIGAALRQQMATQQAQPLPAMAGGAPPLAQQGSTFAEQQPLGVGSAGVPVQAAPASSRGERPGGFRQTVRSLFGRSGTNGDALPAAAAVGGAQPGLLPQQQQQAGGLPIQQQQQQPAPVGGLSLPTAVALRLRLSSGGVEARDGPLPLAGDWNLEASLPLVAPTGRLTESDMLHIELLDASRGVNWDAPGAARSFSSMPVIGRVLVLLDTLQDGHVSKNTFTFDGLGGTVGTVLHMEPRAEELSRPVRVDNLGAGLGTAAGTGIGTGGARGWGSHASTYGWLPPSSTNGFWTLQPQLGGSQQAQFQQAQQAQFLPQQSQLVNQQPAGVSKPVSSGFGLQQQAAPGLLQPALGSTGRGSGV